MSFDYDSDLDIAFDYSNEGSNGLLEEGTEIQ